MSRCGFLLVTALVLCPAVTQADESVPPETVATPSAPEKTGKERLSDKASDEQRVDNCKVPPERRGTKARPSACAHVDQKMPLD